jgi:abequosyltransferase
MSDQLLSTGGTRPLLTIAVPTHNRAGCLRELLSGLAEQLKSELLVELIISDNASSDETPAVIQEFVARGLHVRYIRNTHNIGPDANFLQCFEQARGKYVWLFSDDDLIVPGGIAKIVSYCATANYDLISLRNYAFDGPHMPVPAGARHNVIDISDPRELAKRVHAMFALISVNVVNKDTVLAAGHKPFSELIGTGLTHLGWTYTALSRFSRGLYIYQQLIAVRLNNTGGYNLSQVFGPNLVTITKKWLKSGSLAQLVINGTIQRYWPGMLFEYKNQPSDYFTDPTKPETVLTPLFGDHLRYWLFAYPVAVLPYYLSAGWLLLTRVINRLDRAVGYPTLDWGVKDQADTGLRPGLPIG